MAELNKIKAEKARDEAEKEAGRREEEEQIRMENILSGEIICARQSFQFSFAGNPLLKEKYSDTGKTDMKIKKRWDDDVVFKNCSRAEPPAIPWTGRVSPRSPGWKSPSFSVLLASMELS